jgi:hypothetical protein
MSALNVTTATLINVPGDVDQEIVPDVGEILQITATSQHHVIILNRAHGLIRRSTREMDKVFRSRGDGDRTMGRSGCNSSPIPASPELREPINEAILTAAGIVVKATRWTPPRACE